MASLCLLFFVLGVPGFSTVSEAIENALFSTIDISHSREKGVFDGPRNSRKSGNARNKKHCSLANGRALPNTSGGTPLPLNTFIGFDSSIRCSVSSFAGVHSSVFYYYLGVGRSLYLNKPPHFIRLAVGLSKA
jgi:hypothetical protein